MRLHLFLPFKSARKRSPWIPVIFVVLGGSSVGLLSGIHGGVFVGVLDGAFGGASFGALGLWLAGLPSWRDTPVRRVVQTCCLALFFVGLFYVCRPYGTREMGLAMAQRELVDAESFLKLDPLVAIAASLASRTWLSALAWAGGLLAVCLVLPRMFCGYLCPMGTLIGSFPWPLGRWSKRLHLNRRGWWR